MISKDIQEKLFGIIKEKMIPEYKNMKLYKDKLKEEFIRYLKESYMTDRDHELIFKYPSHIKKVNQVPIAYCYRYGGGDDLKFEHFEGYWTRDDDDMIIKLDEESPSITGSIYQLREVDKEEWKKIGPLLYQYVNARNSYIKKANQAYEFLSHKNTTVTLIKKEFPELYTLYKS